jgi:hypothetical protein
MKQNKEKTEWGSSIGSISASISGSISGSISASMNGSIHINGMSSFLYAKVKEKVEF